MPQMPVSASLIDAEAFSEPVRMGLVALATDLTLSGESIVTRTIREWKEQAPPTIERRPTVFLLLA